MDYLSVDLYSALLPFGDGNPHMEIPETDQLRDLCTLGCLKKIFAYRNIKGEVLTRKQVHGYIITDSGEKALILSKQRYEEIKNVAAEQKSDRKYHFGLALMPTAISAISTAIKMAIAHWDKIRAFIMALFR